MCVYIYYLYLFYIFIILVHCIFNQKLIQVLGEFGSCSEGNQKKAPGNKLSAATPLPGKNGTPTFAAVAAGYDKSPGITMK